MGEHTRQFISGGIGGMAGVIVGYPMDTIKGSGHTMRSLCIFGYPIGRGCQPTLSFGILKKHYTIKFIALLI